MELGSLKIEFGTSKKWVQHVVPNPEVTEKTFVEVGMMIDIESNGKRREINPESTRKRKENRFSLQQRERLWKSRVQQSDEEVDRSREMVMVTAQGVW